MLWSVIMAGGQGTRFWPLSRKSKPKQFLSLVGETSMLEQTVDRLNGVVDREQVLVVTQKDKVAYVKKTLKFKSSQVIGEPIGRNTAPCLILAAAKIFREDRDAVLTMLPADHVIQKTAIFKKALKSASQIAKSTALPVTFGVVPQLAHTGYGYLEKGNQEGNVKGFDFFRLKAFHEKPSAKKAEQFFKSKKFLWNSGMFVWRAEDLLEVAKKHLPEAYQLAQHITEKNFDQRMESDFKKMPNISIDYGLMEKMKNQILTMPVDFGWSDVGNWNAIYDLSEKDAQKNASVGAVTLIRSKGNVVRSCQKRIAMVGVNDFIVVESEDSILICPKSEGEAIKEIVEALKNERLEKHL
jgi:mannose-1-phosphate guanylyltransferase